MDYRELLKKYMEVVYEIAGGDCTGFTAKRMMSDDDYAALCKVSDEVHAAGGFGDNVIDISGDTERFNSVADEGN